MISVYIPCVDGKPVGKYAYRSKDHLNSVLQPREVIKEFVSCANSPIPVGTIIYIGKCVVDGSRYSSFFFLFRKNMSNLWTDIQEFRVI